MPYFFILPAFLVYAVALAGGILFSTLYKPAAWLRPYLTAVLAWSSLGFLIATLVYVAVVAVSVLAWRRSAEPSAVGGVLMAVVVFVLPLITSAIGAVAGAVFGIRRIRRRARIAGAAVLVCVVMMRVAAAQTGTGALPDAEAYLKRGEAAAGAHKYDEAIAEYNEAIRLRPDYAEAYNDRGHAYHWKGGNGNRAFADFTRAIELRPNYPTAYNNRGVVHMAGGSPSKGIPDFNRALELNPSFRNAYVNRANAHLRLLHAGAALDDFHRAGMHPERVAAVLGGVVLLAAVGIGVARRRRFRETRHE